MSVQVHDQQFGVNGHAKSLKLMRDAHVSNSDALINHAEGLDVDSPRPTYDPNHPDNLWPVAVHHPAKGELVVGKSLKGVADPKERARITKENEAAYDAATGTGPSGGYRDAPFVKPQIAVLDPAAEKIELKRKNDELQGQINQLADEMRQMRAERAEPAKTDPAKTAN